MQHGILSLGPVIIVKCLAAHIRFKIKLSEGKQQIESTLFRCAFCLK